jgi:trigger factor
MALEDKIINALLARHPFGVPDSLVMRQIAHQVEHARERMRRQGVDPDRLPWDYDKLIGELRPSAERAVRRALLLEAVAEREGLAATDADVDAEVEKIAQAGQRPAPAVRRMMEKSGDLEALRHGLRDRKTLELLIEHARVTA